MPSEQLHEARESLDTKAMDRHRAIVSICEELEAIDWYGQRMAATDDPELRSILAHNADEEKEHTAMLIEWLRRRDGILDEHLRRFLFQDGRIVDGEDDPQGANDDGSLGIGKPSPRRGEVR